MEICVGGTIETIYVRFGRIELESLPRFTDLILMVGAAANVLCAQNILPSQWESLGRRRGKLGGS